MVNLSHALLQANFWTSIWQISCHTWKKKGPFFSVHMFMYPIKDLKDLKRVSDLRLHYGIAVRKSSWCLIEYLGFWHRSNHIGHSSFSLLNPVNRSKQNPWFCGVSCAEHVTMSFARSGGAGGQNVNKGVVSFHFVLRNTPGNYSDFFNKLSTEVCIQVATSGKNSMSTLQSINSTATFYSQTLHRKDESGKRNCKAYRIGICGCSEHKGGYAV